MNHSVELKHDQCNKLNKDSTIIERKVYKMLKKYKALDSLSLWLVISSRQLLVKHLAKFICFMLRNGSLFMENEEQSISKVKDRLRTKWHLGFL
jgi:hypothetical protein